MKGLNQAIEQAKLEYQSDVEWSYFFQNKFCSVCFYKDENGNNRIEEFGVMEKGLFIEVLPTDEQLKIMFNKLNNTPYREVEIEEYREPDNYDNTGTNPKNFY